MSQFTRFFIAIIPALLVMEGWETLIGYLYGVESFQNWDYQAGVVEGVCLIVVAHFLIKFMENTEKRFFTWGLAYLLGSVILCIAAIFGFWGMDSLWKLAY